MLLIGALLIALLGFRGLVAAAHSGSGGVSPHADGFALHRVWRRASAADTETAYLPIIVGSLTVACQDGCMKVSRVVAQCIANQGGDLAVATCACSAATLDIISSSRSAQLIMRLVHHLGSTNQQGSLPMNAYNSFVNECISLNLTNSASLYTGSGIEATASSVISNLNPSATQCVEKGSASIATGNLPLPTTASGTKAVSVSTTEEVESISSGTTSVVPPPSASAKNVVSSSSGAQVVRARFGIVAALVFVAGLFA